MSLIKNEKTFSFQKKRQWSGGGLFIHKSCLLSAMAIQNSIEINNSGLTNNRHVDNKREKKTENGKCFILLLSEIKHLHHG